MIKKPICHNRYNSARQRFLKAVIENFFAREFPRFFGPVIRQKIAEQLVKIFEDLHPPSSSIPAMWSISPRWPEATTSGRGPTPA